MAEYIFAEWHDAGFEIVIPFRGPKLVDAIGIDVHYPIFWDFCIDI